MGGAIVFFILVVLIAVVIRLAAGASDHERINEEVARRGGTVTGITWEPFGKGWFGEKNERIYKVAWRDKDATHRTAWCKTSMLSGVYFSDETVAESDAPIVVPDQPAPDAEPWQPAPPPPATEKDLSNLTRSDLEQEVQRLRAENETLKRRH